MLQNSLFFTCENSLFHLAEKLHLLFHAMANATSAVIALPTKYIRVNKGIQRYKRVSVVIHCLTTGDYVNMLPVRYVLRFNQFLPTILVTSVGTPIPVCSLLQC